MIRRERHHLGGHNVGNVGVGDGKFLAVQRTGRAAEGKVEHRHNGLQIPHIGGGRVLQPLGDRRCHHAPVHQRAGRLPQHIAGGGFLYGQIALRIHDIAVCANGHGCAAEGTVHFLAGLVYGGQAGGAHHHIHNHLAGHHIDGIAALANVGVYAHIIFFLKGLADHAQRGHAQAGSVQRIHTLVRGGGCVSGLAVYVHGFSHKAAAGAVAQHQIHTAVTPGHQAVVGHGHIDIIPCAQADQLTFAAGIAHAMAVFYFLAHRGIQKFFGRHRKDGGRAAQRSLHLGV